MFSCPCCGQPAEAGLLFPLCGHCAHDVPMELVRDVADGLQEENLPGAEVVLVWVRGGTPGDGLYVERDSLADFAHGVPSAHWHTVGEARDFCEMPGVVVVGGPLVEVAG